MKNEHKIFLLNRRIFWDVPEDRIPHLIKNVPEIAIPRIFQGGTLKEVDSMIDYYGYDEVKETLKKQLSKLHLQVVDNACRMFNLKRKDFQCFKNKQFLALY